MNSPALSGMWLQLLGVLGLETALIALVVAGLRRWNKAATWGRTCCRAGLAAFLVIAAGELSGATRYVGGWTAGKFVALGRKQYSAPSQPAAVVYSQPRLPSPAQRLPMDQAQSSAPATGPRSASDRQTPAANAARTGTLPTAPATTVTDLGEPSDSYLVLWVWLVWSVGTAVGLVRACLGRLLTVLFRFRRRAVADPALVGRAQVLARALGMRRNVRVLLSARLKGPIAFGLVRPTVGLPENFTTSYDANSQEAILAHEVAHLAAYDPFWCFLADVAAALLWWQPAVWWLRRQLHVAGELVADEASLLVADGPQALAECLVQLGTRLSRQPLPGPLGMASFRSHLGRRVQRLVQMERRVWSPPRRVRAALTGIFGSLAMVAIALVCTAWATPRALKEGDSMRTMQLNWKRSLATFALLAAFNGSDAATTDEQSNPPAATEPVTSRQAVAARAAPQADNHDAQDALAKRYGLPRGALQAVPTQEKVTTGQTGAVAATPDGEIEPRHGAQIEAQLKRLRLEQVSFDGLPLGEVLKFLSDESIKRDPEKLGVNFLINPNSPPVVTVGQVDPATGLPVAVPAETFDVSSVTIKFNLPLRHVTMKDVLDAVVKVADHPIEYSLEDYAVVFSVKPQTIEGQPVVVNRMGPLQNVMSPQPAPELPEPEEGPIANEPHRFNIAFGVWRHTESDQVGPAAAGALGDFWNTVGVPWNDAHTESGMKSATGERSPIRVEMRNLGGGWGNSGRMGVQSPMLDSFNYPANNKGGNSSVILHHVPPGKYQLFIYRHGTQPLYYGDYTLTVGDHSYGRKTTSHKLDAVRNKKWVEGSQYVRFPDVTVGSGQNIEILIRPGGPSPTPYGTLVSDAMICGLQLIPAN
jgi:beta-lactamase regulating signal transducer with metallopeptidase domain